MDALETLPMNALEAEKQMEEYRKCPSPPALSPTPAEQLRRDYQGKEGESETLYLGKESLPKESTPKSCPEKTKAGSPVAFGDFFNRHHFEAK